MQRLNIAPSPTLIPTGREYAASPPLLITVHNDPLLLSITLKGKGQCFVETRYKNVDYCVPEEAVTTKRVFGFLMQVIQGRAQ
jgi:hypothetical protein